MNKLEQLEELSDQNNVSVIDFDLTDTNIKGLYCDNHIALNKDIKTVKEKTCVLAEELGHHFTSVGNIVDYNNLSNSKQEHQARVWAYNNLIGLQGLIKAFEYGCRNKYGFAKFLDVTEDFFEETINAYKDKYGLYKIVDNYVIYFIPNFSIIKMY